MKNKNENGLIYGLVNKYFPGMVKIGATRSLDISKRMGVLGTAVPEPFECAFAYKVPHDVLFSIEHTLHDAFADCRVPGSEFFRIDPSKVDKLLLQIGKFEPMKTAVQNAIDTEDAKRKSPRMDFIAMGLPVNTVLYFKDKPEVCCTVATKNRVDYNGRHGVSLSAITKELLGLPYMVQPSPYWQTEDGRQLIDIYKDYTRAHVERVREHSKLVAVNLSKTANAAHNLSEKGKHLIK